MPKRSLLILTITSLLAYSATFAAPVVLAATLTNPSSSGQALEIAPPVISLNLNPGQTTTTQIYLRDISPTKLIVTGQANDFVAAGTDGTPKIILDSNENDPYSLKDWISSLPSLQLIPREIKAMSVTITVPKNASPGGHYGVIRFTATPPNLDSTGVSLSASLGALLLVTISGNITDNLNLQSFTANQNGKTGTFFEAPPLNFSEVLRNTGNVHEQPVGQVTITDTFGRTFAAVNINQPPHNILPSSERKFDQTLDSSVIGDNRMFGRYVANLKVTYGANKKTFSGSFIFWVIPYRLIAAVIAGLVGGFFILRFVIKRYNRHIITQAQRSRRR